MTIEPGVVVKMHNAGGQPLAIAGSIRAEGTGSAPIVFTSFHDDTYGGDLNGDGFCDPLDASSTASCPAPGDWKNITIGSASQNSTFQNVVFRYGGRWFSNMTIQSSVIVEHASATFDRITIEHSMKHGLYLDTSSSTITNSLFQNNVTNTNSAGLFIIRGAPIISDTVFQNNRDGLFSINVALELSGLQFSNNTGSALSVVNASTTLTNSIFSGNALDIEASGNYFVSCSIGCNASTKSPNPL